MSRSFFQTHVELVESKRLPLLKELLAIFNECLRRAYAHGVKEGKSPEEMDVPWAIQSKVFIKTTKDRVTKIVTKVKYNLTCSPAK
jgi:hypothetical protein